MYIKTKHVALRQFSDGVMTEKHVAACNNHLQRSKGSILIRKSTVCLNILLPKPLYIKKKKNRNLAYQTTKVDRDTPDCAHFTDTTSHAMKDVPSELTHQATDHLQSSPYKLDTSGPPGPLYQEIL